MKPGLPVVYFTVFLDLVGFGIILPQLPYYAEAFGATGVWVGAILTAYSAAQLVGASLLGRPYIADVTAPGERAKYMGLLGASIGLGFVFGPALGSGLARFGFGAAAFAAASLAAANLVFAFFRLPETRGPEERRHAHARVDLSNLLDALHHPSTGRLLAATFLSTLAFVAMEATFALLGEARFGLDASRLGLVFAYVGVVMVIVQGGLVGRLAPRFGERALATVGAVVMAASLGALPLVPTLGAALGVLAGLAVGQGLTTPMLATLLSRAADADEQGGTLGLGQSLAAAARAVGAPYAASAAVMVLAALLVGTVRTD